MPTLFSGINMALQALLSHQQSILVTEHNVANANTPGYHRQEAVLAAGIPYPSTRFGSAISAGQMGSGVLVDRIRRFNLEFFDGRLRRELAESKRWETEHTVLQQVEATLAETGDDGLIQKLDAFWSGWQALSSDPSSMSLRADLRDRAVALSQAFNWRASSLIAIRKDQDLAINQRVNDINAISLQVARLNAEISQVKATGNAPNDLLDTRDLLLDRLSELSGAVVHNQDNGEVLVSINGHSLVFGSQALKLTTSRNAENLIEIGWEDGQPFTAQSGELAGLLHARDRVISGQLTALNSLAEQLANRVNQQHQLGYGLNHEPDPDSGPPLVNFFAPPNASSQALNMRVSDEIADLTKIAAGGTANSPGDGNNAIKLVQLQQGLFMNQDTASFNQYYTGKIAEFALDVRGAATRARDKRSVMDSLLTMREAATGVSLDEEAANLIKSQRAYQAAARMMTTIDDMLDRIINGMGLVGR